MVDTVGDLSRVVLIYDWAGQIMENVFGFKTITGGVGASGLASAFQTALVKNTSGGLFYGAVNDLSSASLQVHDVYPGEDALYEHTYTAVAGNTATPEAMPPQSSCVINWKTALKGRAYRGRTYLPGRPATDQLNGTLTAGAIANLGTIRDQMMAVFGYSGSNTDFRLCVISEFLDGMPRATPVGTLVTSGTVRSVVYNQRRRTIGVGR